MQKQVKIPVTNLLPCRISAKTFVISIRKVNFALHSMPYVINNQSQPFYPDNTTVKCQKSAKK